jgi:Flp pilus assembly secretin CpaC
MRRSRAHREYEDLDRMSVRQAAATFALIGPLLALAVPAAQAEARRIAIPASATPGPAPTAAPAAAQPREAVLVTIDHAKVVRLPERTQTVIVGNPIIADVTVQRNGLLIVTGKSYGVTNLIALDGQGTMLAESMINVQAGGNEAVVTVQRGTDRESYACTPHCQPTLQLGDNTDYFGRVSSQSTQRNSLATQR